MRWFAIKFHFLLAHPSQTQKTNFVCCMLEGMPHDCFVIWESVIFDQFAVLMFATWFPFYLKMTLLQDFVSFVLLFQIFPFLFHLIQWATISLRVGEDRSEDRIWMQTNLSQSSYLPIVWVKYISPSLSLSLSSNLLLFELNTAYNTIFARMLPLCYLINWGSLIDCYRFLLSIARSLTYLRASSDRDFSFLLDSLTSWKCVATFTKFVATLPPSSPRL